MKMEETVVERSNYSRKEKFVTVVSVDEDENIYETDGVVEEVMDSSPLPSRIPKPVNNNYAESESTMKGRRPKPSPRQFVTVVSVGSSEKLKVDSSGTATLETNLKVRLDVPGFNDDRRGEKEPEENGLSSSDHKESQVPDQVVVFRLPGERLGLGLKFDGGMAAAEKIRRLFIQSVAPDSPAARATVPWGDLDVGDQILHIEGCQVSSLTRVECVNRLKEASVKLTIGVLKGNGQIPELDETVLSQPETSTNDNKSGRATMPGYRAKRMPPPPLPPRSLSNRIPARPPKDVVELPPPPEGFEDFDSEESMGKIARGGYHRGSYSEVFDGEELLAYMSSSHRHVPRLPPAPAVYFDLLSEEDKASRARCESESDETNSSASTVIDRLSISSSRNVSRNSSFNAAADAAKFDLSRALSPFEHLEDEMNRPAEKRQRSLSTPHLTYSGSFSSKTQKTLERVTPLENGAAAEISIANGLKTSPKGRVRTTMKSFSFSLKSRPFSWHSAKQSDEETALEINNVVTNVTKKNNNKRPAPLPPQRLLNTNDLPPNNEVHLLNLAKNNGSLSSNGLDDCNIAAESEADELQDVFDSPPRLLEKVFQYQVEEDLKIGEDKRQEEEEDKIYPGNASGAIVNGEADSNVAPLQSHSEFVKSSNKQSNYQSEEPIYDNGISSTVHEDVLEGNRGFGSEDLKLSTVIDGYSSQGTDEEYDCHEPLDTDTYDSQKAFFINEVSNPSYGLSPLLEDQRSESASSILHEEEIQEELYEEIDGGSRERSSDPNETDCNRNSDLSSISSNYSISSTSLSSREMDEMRAEEDLEDPAPSSYIVNNKMYELALPADPPQGSPTQDTYSSVRTIVLEPPYENDYNEVVIQTSRPTSLSAIKEETSTRSSPSPEIKETSLNFNQSFTQISRDVRLRSDLGELLKKDLNLGDDCEIEIQEEELVESKVECENEEELLLVLRALRCDNSFNLDEPQELRLAEGVRTNHRMTEDNSGDDKKDSGDDKKDSDDNPNEYDKLSSINLQSEEPYEESFLRNDSYRDPQTSFGILGQKDIVPTGEGVSDPVTSRGRLPSEGERNGRRRSHIEEGGTSGSRAPFNAPCQSRFRSLPPVTERDERPGHFSSTSARDGGWKESPRGDLTSSPLTSLKEGISHASNTLSAPCEESEPGEKGWVNGAGREVEEAVGGHFKGSQGVQEDATVLRSSSRQNCSAKSEATYLNFKDPRVLSSVLNPSATASGGEFPSRALRKYLDMVAQNKSRESSEISPLCCPDEALIVEPPILSKGSYDTSADRLSEPVAISDPDQIPQPDPVTRDLPSADPGPGPGSSSGVCSQTHECRHQNESENQKIVREKTVTGVKIGDKNNNGRASAIKTAQSTPDIGVKGDLDEISAPVSSPPSTPLLDSHRTQKKEKSVSVESDGVIQSSLKESDELPPAGLEPSPRVDEIEERKVYQFQGGNANVTLFEQRCSSTVESQGSSPPSYSRLPPDGHEFPNTYSEGLQERISRISQYSHQEEQEYSETNPKLSNGRSPATLPRAPTKGSPSPETRSLARWRRQDERSEKSVRDKIAMFSSENKSQQKARKINRSESVSSDTHETNTMKRSLTEDDIRIESPPTNGHHDPKSNKDSSPDLSPPPLHGKLGKAPVYSSMVNVHSSDSESKENVKPASSETDVREKGSSSRSSKEFNGSQKSKLKTKINESKGGDSCLSGLNNRSQSLIDIGRSSRMKRHSVGAYDRPSVYKYGVEKPEDKQRRTSLNNMIEQRRKSMSKLRGLVIPETRSGEGNDARLPIDLPRISSNTSSTTKTMSLPRDESTRMSRLYKADSVSSIDSCSSSVSRHSGNAPNSSYSGSRLQKLSPANNRKCSLGTPKNDSLPPLSYRSNRNPSPMSDFSGPSSTPRTVSPQRSSERALTPSSDTSFEAETSKYSNNERVSYRSNLTMKVSLDQRLSKSEDSDNDSAVSSTQSSFSQSLSPRASPMPDNYDPDDRHSPSRSCRSQHSPQSSFDELDPKRVLKNGTIEAENRRNILKSAKFSSGRSSDEQSTPEIVRKYSKETPAEAFPDRLDYELRDGPPSRKSGLRREGSIESTTSVSSHHSSLSSSRRNSRDSVIHISKPEQHRVSAEQVYFDHQGDMYKETQVKVAYLNEIVDDFVELPDNRENVVAEIPISTIEPSKPTENTATTMNPKADVATHKDTKWSALEQKYSKRSEHESFESKFQKYISPTSVAHPERNRSGVTTKKGDFRALADKWKQRVEEEHVPGQPSASVPRRDSNPKIDRVFKREGSVESNSSSSLISHSRTVRSLDESSYSSSIASSSSPRFFEREERPTSLDIPRADVPDRKYSVPEYGSSLKLREKREGSTGEISSRPTSLIEGSLGMDTLQQDSQYMTSPLSPSSTSTDSREDLLDSSESSLSRTGSKEVLDAFSKPCLNSSGTPKMSEIMRAFERHDMNTKGSNFCGSHPRMSSLDSTASDDLYQGAHYGSVSSLASGQRDQYGSITSLSSSTSIISPQELAQLIEEANHSLEESGTPSHEILVVVLHREIVGHGSIGITLAGGADYETKEITVHKVIPGSLSDRDGRIQKGDRILSINGKTLRGVSHREALNILKSPRPEVVLVLSRSRSVTPQENTVTASYGDSEGGFSHRPVFVNHVPPPRPPKILESPMDSKSLVSDSPCDSVPRGPPMTITLVKDGAGLGFSLEGGKDSPLGDRPLIVKKIFSGGAADKGGILVVGDELLSINNVDLTNMARIEAWNFLKKLNDGTVALVIRKKLPEGV